MNIIDWVLYIPLTLCVCYLLLYAIASKFYRAPQYPEARTLRHIAVLFPAYKEDRVILFGPQFSRAGLSEGVVRPCRHFRPDATGNERSLTHAPHPATDGGLHGKLQSQSAGYGHEQHRHRSL